MSTRWTKDAIYQKLTEYSLFVDGWNGPGSYAPTKACAAAILDCLPRVYNFCTDVPVPMITRQGHLELYWHHEGEYTDISFNENGVCSFFHRAASGREIWIDDVTF